MKDEAQRREALDPGRSFIVQAPAGSGKTGLLVQRFLALLTTVHKPESVVAITFTRKAAGEMRERILDVLLYRGSTSEPENEFTRRTRALAEQVLAQDRRHAWNLLADPGRLQLQTIDSLCATLARGTPVLSESAGSLEVIEEASELYDAAATETLRRLAEGPEEFQALLTRLGIYFDNDFRCLTDLIVRMLAQRDQWQFSEDNIAPDAEDFYLLLQAAQSVLRDIFKEQGRLDFTAITEAAIRVLGSPDRPTDVLYGLDYRIQHLLVDEFQDTSLAQYKLLEALTAQWSQGDGHTLFLVGDPMQSIYRFRGAEVSLFQRTWKEERLNAVRLHPLALDSNFRSLPAILKWVSEQFTPMMANGDEHSVEFRPVEAARTAAGPAPHWHAFVGDADESESAAAVAECAQAAQKRGSVAILVRNRKHLVKILPRLRQAEIGYEAVEIDELATRQHILDLMSLTRAVLHVADRTAWLACLRAPWCGLSLHDLSGLAEGERDRLIIQLLADSEKLAGLSPEGRASAVRTGEILSAAVARAGRLQLRTLIEDTWLLLGGPAVLAESYKLDDVRTFLDLLGGLEEAGTIVDFTQLDARLAILFAKGAASDNAVQVMTVFKAKGLEFDTVILPRLEGTAQTSEGELLAWDETIREDGTSELRVAAKPRKGEKSAIYDAICKARHDKDREELKRLLYVACTRAKNELYLAGNVKLKNGELERPRSGSFLRLLWPLAEAEFQGTLRRTARQMDFNFEGDSASEATVRSRTLLRRLPAGWKLPRFERWVDWRPAFRETTPSTRRVTYAWVSDTARHVGTVTHALLRRAAEGSENWTADRVRAMGATVRAELLRLGVSRADEASATERVLRAVSNTLASPRGQWILAPHPDARTEWALAGRLDDRVVNGTIDRSFRDEDGRLWIIDFKTSEHEGANLKRFLDEEQRRYRAQLESYGALLARMQAGPISLGLYFPLLDTWREWEFEERRALTGS